MVSRSSFHPDLAPLRRGSPSAMLHATLPSFYLSLLSSWPFLHRGTNQVGGGDNGIYYLVGGVPKPGRASWQGSSQKDNGHPSATAGSNPCWRISACISYDDQRATQSSSVYFSTTIMLCGARTSPPRLALPRVVVHKDVIVVACVGIHLQVSHRQG